MRCTNKFMYTLHAGQGSHTVQEWLRSVKSHNDVSRPLVQKGELSVIEQEP